MPNLSRQHLEINIKLQLHGIEHLYRYYLRGFSRAIASPAELERSAQMIAGLEDVLTRSGYLTELEIKRIHAEAGLPGDVVHG